MTNPEPLKGLKGFRVALYPLSGMGQNSTPNHMRYGVAQNPRWFWAMFQILNVWDLEFGIWDFV